MPSNVEDVPEIPPSPQQLSVKLYSLSDVEHLLQESDTPSHTAPGGLNIGMPPLPLQVSIHLYPLSDLSHNSAFSVSEAGSFEQEVLPSPERTSISLYPVPEIEQSAITSDNAEDIRDTFPSPPRLNLNLYSLPDVRNILADTTSLVSAPDAISSREPFPISHSINLFHNDYVSRWADSTLYQTPTPRFPEIPLHSISELSSPVPNKIYPTEIKIAVSPPQEQVLEVGSENVDAVGGPVLREELASSLPASSLSRTNLQSLQRFGSPVDSRTRRQDGSEDVPATQPLDQPESSTTGHVGEIDVAEAFNASNISIGGGEAETLKDAQIDAWRGTGPEFIMDGQGGEGEANIVDYDAALYQVNSALHVPFVGEVAEIVGNLLELFRRMKQNKERAYSIASKCVEILVLFNEKASWIKISELSMFAGELIAAFVKVKELVGVWSGYSRVKAFLNQTKIKEDLNQCEMFLEPASDIVQIKIDRLRDLAYKMNEFRDREEIFEEAGLLIRPSAKPISTVSQGKKAEPSSHQGPETNPYRQEGRFEPHQQIELSRIPKIMNSEVACDATKPVFKGRHSDLWIGLWIGRISVALKELKYDKDSSIQARKRLEKEALVWSRLQHNNILPFYGIVTDLGSQAQLVVPWQENGNVLEYVKTHLQASKFALLSDAADGLGYLHSKSIIHGHVKCTNILVKSTGQACVCDFHMSNLSGEIAPREGLSSQSPRWASKETLSGQPPTMESDVYSFGISILELITGDRPYANVDSEAKVTNMIMSQTAQTRPRDESSMNLLSDELWGLMLQCWRDPPSRPRIGVLGVLLTKLGRLEEENIRARNMVDIEAEVQTERQEQMDVETHEDDVQVTRDSGPPPSTSDPRVDL
ncbi:hypothetical protein CPB83DRAFT_493148 [Crepidotus variabilis]|uniref:Protein kinase domain-containing protein n=1 Tax=Crepidotus variabilis TaxID=179855 RepID=A0A9P6EC01_9AGAR|nr:hypothetical protein CPB83DRAFT_493148 [Crepidotus variabilis]